MNSNQSNVVSVSGGKDSTALLLLAIEREATPQAVFADTGHEHPLTYEYLDYLESHTGIHIQRVRADFSARMATRRANIQDRWEKSGISQERIDRAKSLCHPTGIPFLDLCLLKGRFPSTRARFCSEELKVLPITQQVMLPLVTAGKDVWSWQGIRADESPRRAQMTEIELLDFGITAYRPLIKWSADDVFAMHDKHGIDPNPLYKLGMGRVGCMPCIMCRKSELAEISRRFPDQIARVREWESLVSDASKRGLSTLFPADTVPGEGDTRANIDAAVEWSKTSRGGRQFGLFTDAEPIPSCSSVYGLCEIAGD